MAKPRLSEKQWQAIALLSQPGMAGMTYEQIADEVGVTTMTLWRWRQQDRFNEEIKRQVLRNAVRHLPDMYEAVPRHVIEEGNAAMFRTFVQSLGMLKDHIEIEDNRSDSRDLDEMKAQIEEFRQKSRKESRKGDEQ